MIVYVEEKDYDNDIFNQDPRIKDALLVIDDTKKPQIRKFDAAPPQFTFPIIKNVTNSQASKIDFIVCVGGDGTVLYVSTLFQVFFLINRYS